MYILLYCVIHSPNPVAIVQSSFITTASNTLTAQVYLKDATFVSTQYVDSSIISTNSLINCNTQECFSYKYHFISFRDDHALLLDVTLSNLVSASIYMFIYICIYIYRFFLNFLCVLFLLILFQISFYIIL
jgi:hypothetical protein